MRNMSFKATVDQVRAGTKTVTRRQGWWFLEPGDELMACVQCQGLGKGGKIEKIRPIRILSTRGEPLSYVMKDPREVVLEGFPDMEPLEFVRMYCKLNKAKKMKPSDFCNRIEYEYI